MMDENYFSTSGFLTFILNCHPDIHRLLLISVLVKTNSLKEISELTELPYRQIQKSAEQAKTLYKLWVEAEEGDRAALRILQGSVPEGMEEYHPLFGWDTSVESLFDINRAKEVCL